MNIKRLFCLVAALLLVPAVAAADDLSATLAGGGGSGIASIVTGDGTVSYAIVTNGIGNVTGAEIRQGAGAFVNLDPPGGGASAAGVVHTAADCTQSQLAEAANFLNANYSGLTMEEVRGHLDRAAGLDACR